MKWGRRKASNDSKKDIESRIRRLRELRKKGNILIPYRQGESHGD